MSTSDEHIQRLKDGNERFVADKLDGKLQDSERREPLTGGQSPFAIILSCADSRVVPELPFDTGLGELFVLRVASEIISGAVQSAALKIVPALYDLPEARSPSYN